MQTTHYLRWTTSAALVLLAPCTNQAAAREAVRPNVVLIFCDDLGYGNFELYDLAADRRQQTDLSTKHPEKLAELSRLLVERHRQVQAHAPIWSFEP